MTAGEAKEIKRKMAIDIGSLRKTFQGLKVTRAKVQPNQAVEEPLATALPNVLSHEKTKPRAVITRRRR